MPILKINKETAYCQHFITITVKKWYNIFGRYNRWIILANALKFYQKNKGLKIYSYVFMYNHIHLIAQSNDLIAFLRDFKKYTSKELKKNLKETEPEVLKWFIDDKTGKYNFWKIGNKPKIMGTEKFFLQKMNYYPHHKPLI